jgi:hypothetical protein
VSIEEGERMAKDYNIAFFETVGQSDDVSAPFLALATAVKHR